MGLGQEPVCLLLLEQLILLLLVAAVLAVLPVQRIMERLEVILCSVPSPQTAVGLELVIAENRLQMQAAAVLVVALEEAAQRD